jgi:hypothetical protein
MSFTYAFHSGSICVSSHKVGVGSASSILASSTTLSGSVSSTMLISSAMLTGSYPGLFFFCPKRSAYFAVRA